MIDERYSITGLIGEGGMGEVYEAQHLAIGRLVAIKVLQQKKTQDREAISRLRHEARIAGTLGHPNICAVYDLGQLDDGSPYLVMERLHGETLAERLKRQGTLSVEELVDMILQVLSALVAAHQQGITHRDLKPDNIFLSHREGMSPVPKLLDFGISKSESLKDSFLDPMRDPVGTPYYMSPEQARGERKLDLRVDLWGVGVILYESLTGRRPFEAKNYNALLVSILTATPRPVDELKPTLPAGLARIVDKALTKDVNARFQSAKELLQAIRMVGNDPEGQSPSRPVPLLREEHQPRSSQRLPFSLTESQPFSAGGQSSLRDSDRQPGSSSKRPPVLQAEQQPLSSKRLPPIIVQEPGDDDQDSTFVFSRADMSLPAPTESETLEPAPEAGAAEQPVYLPFTDEDEQTLIERPAFLNDTNDTITAVRPPGRKD